MRSTTKEASPCRKRTFITFCLTFLICLFVFKDILLNDAFKLDWTFRMSFASDIARVSQSVCLVKEGLNENGEGRGGALYTAGYE